MIKDIHRLVGHRLVEDVVVGAVKDEILITVNFLLRTHQQGELVIDASDTHLVARLGEQVHLQQHSLVGTFAEMLGGHGFRQFHVGPITKVAITTLLQTLSNHIIVISARKLPPHPCHTLFGSVFQLEALLSGIDVVLFLHSDGERGAIKH